MNEKKVVYLKSGLSCFVISEYKDKYWLVGCDNSWGPGTIKKSDTFDEPKLLNINYIENNKNLSWEQKFYKLKELFTQKQKEFENEKKRLRRSIY